MLTAQFKFRAMEFTGAMELKKRHFEAAGYGPRTDKWYRRSRGPVSDNMSGLARLRGFSRDLVRNNPYAQRAVNIIAKNTVGTGITPTFKGANEDAIKRRWAAWAGKKSCDFNDLMNLAGLQEQVMRAVAESGDAIILRRYNFDNPMGFELQVLESDYLDETVTRPEPDGGFVLQGVAFNNRGKRVGYYLHEQHPTDLKYNATAYQSRLVPASEVIHVFEVLRPGQVRGIPMGVSAFIRMKDFDEFQDAQLYKQKVASLFVMTVTNSVAPMGSNGQYQPYDGLDRMIPGAIEELPFGKDIKFSQPPTTEGTPEYMRAVLQSIAVGYNVTYEALTNDYSNVNFSSGRMGWLEFSRNVQSWQDNIMITMFCEPVYEWFQQGLKLMGGYASNIDITWTTPRREMIDPMKEGAAALALIKGGIISRQEFQRQLGYDPADMEAEIKQDMEVDKKLDATFSTSVKTIEPPKPAATSTKVTAVKTVAKK